MATTADYYSKNINSKFVRNIDKKIQFIHFHFFFPTALFPFPLVCLYLHLQVDLLPGSPTHVGQRGEGKGVEEARNEAETDGQRDEPEGRER